MLSVNRRAFLRLAGALATWIVFPIAMRNEVWQPVLPTGLGIGINLHQPEGERDAALRLALELAPPWWYHWRGWPLSPHPGFVPMATPAPNPPHGPFPIPPAEALGWRGAMLATGGDPLRLPWLIGNEYERSGWTAQATAQATAQQVDVLRQAGLAPVVLAPNGNITTPAHLEYLADWQDAAAALGLSYVLAVHVYEHRTAMLDMAWQRFRAMVGNVPVIVTECGAGPDRPLSDWLAVMPWFYGLLSGGQAQALAPFGVFAQTDASGSYPGFLDASGAPNELGCQWLEFKAQARM
jgi:hypothetical protein